MKAARANDLIAVKDALKAGADPNAAYNTTTALHLACKGGMMELANLLLQSGANVNAQTSSGWTAMHFAVNGENLELIRLLRAFGGKADIVNEWLKTPFDLAKDKENATMIKLLQTNPSELSIPDLPTSSPEIDTDVLLSPKGSSSPNYNKLLLKAIRSDDLGSVMMCLDKGADLNLKSAVGMLAPLHVAVKGKSIKVVRILLERGADVNIQTQAGWTPLHIAVNTGNHDVAELLKGFGAKIDIVNEWLKTSMDMAKERKDDRMFEILQRKPGPVITPRSAMGTTSTPSPRPTPQTAPEQVVSLPEELPPLSVSTDEGSSGKSKSSLHKRLIRAVRANDVTELENALREGANPETPSSSSSTRAVHIAAKHSSHEIVIALGKHGADFNAQTKTGWTALHFAASAGSVDTVQALLAGGADRGIKTELGKTALDVAKEKGFRNVIAILADITPRSQSNSSTVIVATTPGDLFSLLESGNFVSLDQALKEGGDADMVNSSTGFTLLHTAAKSNMRKGCDVILEHGANVNPQTADGWTPLHFAAQNGSLDVVELLRSYGARTDVLNNEQKSAIDVARESGHSAIVEVLRTKQEPRSGVGEIPNSPALSPRAPTGKVLHRAVRNGHVDEVKDLLQRKVDVNWVDSSSGMSALLLACKVGNLQVARLLVDAGASLDVQSEAGWCPLHFAVKSRLYDLALFLMECGARTDISNEWLKTPVDLCKEQNDVRMMTILRDRLDPGPSETTPAAAVAASPRKPIAVSDEQSSPRVDSPSPRSPPSSPKPDVVSPRGSSEKKSSGGGVLKTLSKLTLRRKVKNEGPLERDNAQADIVEAKKKQMEEEAKKKQAEAKAQAPAEDPSGALSPRQKISMKFATLRGKKGAKNVDGRKSWDQGKESENGENVKGPSSPHSCIKCAAIIFEGSSLCANCSEGNPVVSPREKVEPETKPSEPVVEAVVDQVATSTSTTTTVATPAPEEVSPQKDLKVSVDSANTTPGLTRGKCGALDCKCERFQCSSSSESSTICSECNHFASQHRKIFAAPGEEFMTSPRKSENLSKSPGSRRMMQAEASTPTVTTSSPAKVPAGISSGESVSQLFKKREAAIKQEQIERELGSPETAAVSVSSVESHVSGEGIEDGVQSMSPVTFVVETRDSKGNLWTTAEDVEAIIRDPSGKKVRCKTFHTSQGRYEVSYKRPYAGTYNVQVKVSGNPVWSVPKEVKAIATPSPELCIAKGSALENGKVSGGLVMFAIEVYDQMGDPFEGKCSLNVSITCDGSKVDHEERESGTPGSWVVEYVRARHGRYVVNVLVNDSPIQGSPFSFEVAAPKETLLLSPRARLLPLSPRVAEPTRPLFSATARVSSCKTSLKQSQRKRELLVLEVVTLEKKVFEGSHQDLGLKVVMDGLDEDVEIEKEEEGVFVVMYKPVLPGTHKVDVKGNSDVQIEGGSFELTVEQVADPDKCEVVNKDGFSSGMQQVGRKACVGVAVRDVCGSFIRHVEGVDLVLSLQYPSGQTRTFSPSGGEDGVSEFFFDKSIAGRYTAAILMDGVDIEGSPFRFTVYPTVDASASSIRGTQDALKGSETLLTIRLVDCNGDEMDSSFRLDAEGNVEYREKGRVAWTPSESGSQKIRVVVDGDQGEVVKEVFVESPRKVVVEEVKTKEDTSPKDTNQGRSLVSESWREQVDKDTEEAERKQKERNNSRLEELEYLRSIDSSEHHMTPAQVRYSLSQGSPSASPSSPSSSNKTAPRAVSSKLGTVPDTGGLVLTYATIKGGRKNYIYHDTIKADILEAYLSDEEFTKIFGETKPEFYGRPLWKRTEILKKLNLF